MHPLISTLDLKNAELECRPEWAAAQPDHRASLRKALWLRLKERHLHDRNPLADALNASVDEVLNLETVPYWPGYSISISHCPEAGGFVICENAWLQIGFDIEISERVGKEHVARVSTPIEVAAAPTPAALWCAKEATFKSLFKQGQPSTLSEIEVSSWNTDKFHNFQFFAKVRGFGDYSIAGAVNTNGRLIMGLALFAPQLWSGPADRLSVR